MNERDICMEVDNFLFEKGAPKLIKSKRGVRNFNVDIGLLIMTAIFIIFLIMYVAFSFLLG